MEFEIVFRRDSYVTIKIEAESEEEAKERAWAIVEDGVVFAFDHQWEISSVEEL